MSWNGELVIDLDSHVVERADRFYQDYIDPSYRGAYQQLCDGVAQQAKAGHRYSLFGSRTSVVEPIETGRPLGTRDVFGLSQRSDMEGGRKAFPPGRPDALPPIRPEASWDVKVRLEDMDRAMVDVGVLYPTHVSSYCALRDGGFENALYRAYHRWVADFCAQAPKRLKWTLVANMRDVAAYVIASDRSARVPAVYLSKDLGTGKSVQWKFHLEKSQRTDLWQRTQYFEAETFNPSDVPSGSLLVLDVNNRLLNDLIGPARCSIAHVVKDVANAPSATILRRN